MKNKLKVLVVTDIFGCCTSISNLEKYLQSKCFDVMIVDPYKGIEQNFKNENEAYNSFIKNCNHENYFKLILKKQEYFEADFIIGFSAGANVVWRLSSFSFKNCKNIMSFYPTQIYKYQNINPINSMHVIFPKEELKFEVGEVKENVQQKEKVTAEQLLYSHGFMNNLSPSYDKQAQKLGMRIINKIVGIKN